MRFSDCARKMRLASHSHIAKIFADRLTKRIWSHTTWLTETEKNLNELDIKDITDMVISVMSVILKMSKVFRKCQKGRVPLNPEAHRTSMVPRRPVREKKKKKFLNSKTCHNVTALQHYENFENHILCPKSYCIHFNGFILVECNIYL